MATWFRHNLAMLAIMLVAPACTSEVGPVRNYAEQERCIADGGKIIQDTDTKSYSCVKEGFFVSLDRMWVTLADRLYLIIAAGALLVGALTWVGSQVAKLRLRGRHDS